MATTELTGAEEVAWDLSDLYAGIDDPAHRRATSRRRGRRGRVPRALPRQGRRPLAPRARRGDRRSASGSSRSSRAPLYYAHLIFSTNMADPARGALRREAPGEGRRPRDAAPLLRPRVGRVDDDVADAAARRPRARPLAPLARARCASSGRTCSREPEEKILTEKSVSGVVGLVAALRGAARRAPRRARRRASCRLETAMARLYSADRDDAPRRPPRRSPRRSSRVCARARTSSTRSCSTSRSTTACAATRPGSPPATSPTRRPTRPSQALIDAATSRYDVPQRYYRLKARLLGLDRLEHYDRFAPVADGRVEDVVGRGARRRRRGVRRLLAEAGDIVERFFDDDWIDAPVAAGQATRARSAPRPSPACTRTSS